MGSIDQISNIGDLVGDVGELLKIVIGLLKGDLSVLSTEGSLSDVVTAGGE